jgi:hypothetical protein
MKGLLIGLMVFNVFSTYASELQTKDLPHPCLLECIEIDKEIPRALISTVTWGRKVKKYVLMKRDGVNPPEIGFNYIESELESKNIKLDFGDNLFRVHSLHFTMPGNEGDLSLIPEELRQIMVPLEEVMKMPEISNINKKQCWLSAFYEKADRTIEEQILDTLVDTVANFENESYPFVFKRKISHWGVQYNLYILTKINHTYPTVYKQLNEKLTKLRQIGVCKP